MLSSSRLIRTHQRSQLVERAVLQHPHRLVAASQLRGNLAPFQTGDPQLDNAALVTRQVPDGVPERVAVERAEDLLFGRSPGIRDLCDLVQRAVEVVSTKLRVDDVMG